MRWHYQWMVLHDFVERITETGIVATLLSEGRKFYRFGHPTELLAVCEQHHWKLAKLARRWKDQF